MIQLKEEFKNLIPPLTQEEFRQLEQNIIAEGIRENILTWQGIIIDGHNRYKIATKWGLEYETTSKHFKDEEAVKEWMILNQFGRRNLSNYQRSVLALELEEVFTKKAKENQLSGLKQNTVSTKYCERIEKIWDDESLSYDVKVRLVDNEKIQQGKEIQRINKEESKLLYIAKSNENIKIGISSYPEDRIKQLKTGNPNIELLVELSGGRELEKILHNKFKDINIGGEWFGVDSVLLSKIIDYAKRESERLKTTKHQISKIASVGHDTITRVKKIEEKADEETKAKLRTGEISINQVYTDIKKQEKREEQRTRVLSERNNDNISTEENIKNGDSLEILETLPDESIDIILTDPPYGISYISNRSIFEDTITKRGLMNDGKEAIELLDKTCEILSRKAAKNSHLYFFCSWSVFSSFESIIGKYFTIKTPIVWDKGNKGSGDLDNDWGNQTEIVIFCTKGKKLINKRLGNIINVPRMHTSKMIHPTQKPEELLKTILDVSYIDGDFVVDPFMGSGSTIKVANNMGAKSLGIELDNEMFQIANKYLKNA
jgi:DNA modification methylase